MGDEDIPIAQGAEINITTDDKYATASDNKNMYVYSSTSMMLFCRFAYTICGL